MFSHVLFHVLSQGAGWMLQKLRPLAGTDREGVCECVCVGAVLSSDSSVSGWSRMDSRNFHRDVL